MPFPIRCPGCEASLNVAENLIGKTIKCNKCGEMVTVKAPAAAKAPARAAKAPARAAKAAVVVEDDDDALVPAKTPRRRDADVDRPTIKATRRRDEDDEFDDRPRKKAAAASKSKAPLLVGGLAVVLLVGGGATGAYYAFFKDKKSDTTQNSGTPMTPPPVTPSVTPSDEGNKPADENKTPANTTAIPPANTPPANTTAQTPTTTQTPTNGFTIPQSNSAEYMTKLMGGIMDDITLRKVKMATVFIVVEEKNGKATGSGWFGIEPGIVFTNAHVIGMLAPGSSPPQKITIYLNSGERGQTPGLKEREIPHNRIKILGVDRTHDLAILQIIGEPDLPEPLKVRVSRELREMQRVSTFGFPRGYSTSTIAGGGENQPVVSVRPTAIVALRYDRFGELRLVQIEGAVNQGNSGGPICDADGSVIAVTDVGIPDRDSGGLTALIFGVATEHVFGLLSGCIDEIEYEQPYVDGDKVKVPVRMTVVDPLGRFKNAGIASWVGDSTKQFRPPGMTRTGILPSDKDFSQVALKYDPVKKVATGELVYNQLSPGLAYWAQPYYSTAKTPLYWNPGTILPLSGPPVDRVSTTLRANLRPGTVRPITLSHEFARSEDEEGEGESKDDRTKIKFLMKGNERTIEPDRNDQRSAARIRISYDDIDVKAVVSGREVQALPAQIMLPLKKGINTIEAFGYLNRAGELYKYITNTLAAESPLIRSIAPIISNDVLHSLQVCSITIPNKELQPLEKWGGTQNIVLSVGAISASRDDEETGPGSRPAPGGRGTPPRPKPREYKYTQEITYTFLGTRTRGGKKEAVVKVEGKATPAAGQPKDSVSGIVKGYAFIDINNGIVVESEIESEFEIDTSERGFKKRFSSLNKYKVVRGGQVN